MLETMIIGIVGPALAAITGAYLGHYWSNKDIEVLKEQNKALNGLVKVHQTMLSQIVAGQGELTKIEKDKFWYLIGKDAVTLAAKLYQS